MILSLEVKELNLYLHVCQIRCFAIVSTSVTYPALLYLIILNAGGFVNKDKVSQRRKQDFHTLYMIHSIMYDDVYHHIR